MRCVFSYLKKDFLERYAPFVSRSAPLTSSVAQCSATETASSHPILDLCALEEAAMFEHSISRNQRNKGSKVKTVLQVSLILGVAIWLLYQIKHSYDNKIEYSTTDDDKLSHGDVPLYGRKGRAGSENVIIIDTHEANSDEPTETKEAGGGQAYAADWEKNSKNLNEEHEESQEDIKNGSNEDENADSQASHGDEITNNGNEDENADSQVNHGDEITNNGFSEGKEEVLHLPSEREGLDQNDSLDQNELSQDNIIAQNSTLDGTKSDEVEAISSDEETIKSSGTQTELGENSQDQGNTEVSTNDNVLERETVELHVVDSGSEVSVNDTLEDAVSHDESITNGQQNASATDTVTYERDTLEIQRDNTEIDTGLGEELTGLAISTEGSNEAAKIEPFESHVDIASSDSASEEEKSDMKEVEAQGDNASDTETTANNVSEEEKADQNSTEELPDHSLSSHSDEQNNSENYSSEAEAKADSHSDEQINSENDSSVSEAKADSQNDEQNNLENDSSVAEANTDSQSDEQNNSESDSLVAESKGDSQSDEQNNSETDSFVAEVKADSQSDEQHNSETESQGDAAASETHSTSVNALQDAE